MCGSDDHADETPRVVRYRPDDDLEHVVDDPASGGTYVLVFDLATPTSVEVGALGTHELPAGEYAYVGSAFGAGGFGRAERHRRKLDEASGTVHWHVDALTTRPETSFVVAYLLPDVDLECVLARRLPAGPLDGFGSSDCDCRSHLSSVDGEAVERTIRTTIGSVDSP
jgi:endonuclease-3